MQRFLRHFCKMRHRADATSKEIFSVALNELSLNLQVTEHFAVGPGALQAKLSREKLCLHENGPHPVSRDLMAVLLPETPSTHRKSHNSFALIIGGTKVLNSLPSSTGLINIISALIGSDSAVSAL